MYTPAALLDAVVRTLEEDSSPIIVNTWFGDAKALAITPTTFVIRTTSLLKQEHLKEHYQKNVQEIVTLLYGQPLQPVYVFSDEECAPYIAGEDGMSTGFAKYTFERFIVGPQNKFAHAAAMAVATVDRVTYNPLFIYGDSGLGKTHLLYAIAGETKKRHPEKTILYVKGDDFTNELIGAIRTASTAALRDKYRTADLLLMDDIQFIAGKKQTEEEFFHTFNHLHEAGKQIVLTSDRPPKEIATLEDRLRTRFEWGLLADIQRPDWETRKALVIDKAMQMGMDLNDDCVEYITDSVDHSVRQIEGVLKKMEAYHKLMGKPLDMNLTRTAVMDVVREERARRPSAEKILQEVSAYYNVEADKVKGKARSKDVAFPRQMSMYMMRQLSQMSMPDIGKFFDRDHTTVLYGLDRIETALREDPQLQNVVDDITQNLRLN